jgi:hypothetical protein
VQRGLFTIFMVAQEPDGRTTEVRQKTFRAEVPTGQGAAVAESTFVVSLDGTPGEHRVAIALRDELAETTSFVQRNLDIPGPIPSSRSSR